VLSATQEQMCDRAVVIGGGIAGLLTAKALAETFSTVTVVESDPAPDAARPRKGIPQGNHIHVLWSSGAQSLQRFFPELFEGLLAAGATRFDNSRDMRWFHGGVWKLRHDSGLNMYSQTQPLIERHMRSDLEATRGVQLVRARGIGLELRNGKIVGVQINRGDAKDVIDAQLVVDASGRGSRLSRWLSDVGIEPPKEQTVAIDLRYSTRTYDIPDDPRRDWKVMAVYANPPKVKKSGVIFPIEGRRWIVTLGGCLTDHPPSDPDGFMKFAANLEHPALHEAIAGAEPVSEIRSLSFPKQRWLRFDRSRDLPRGLLVVGDAMCSFNPLYGQGMSVAGLEVCALADALRDNGLQELERRYFKAARGIVSNAWLLATSTDYRYPELANKRWPGAKLLGAYTDHMLRRSADSSQVLGAFLEVLHMRKSPLHLAHPKVLSALARGS